jgi:hypothetical protein
MRTTKRFRLQGGVRRRPYTGVVGIEYYTAAICERGDLVSEAIELHKRIYPKCSKCGADVLSKCRACRHPIQGMSREPFGNYVIPKFCHVCAGPFPWAKREALFYNLLDMLNDEDIDPADSLKVRDALDALRDDPDASEEVQIERWRTVKRYAPGLASAGLRIIEAVTTAGIKAGMGM